MTSPRHLLHYTMSFPEYNDTSWNTFLLSPIKQFCVLRKPLRQQCASSERRIFPLKSESDFNCCTVQSANSLHILWSFSFNSWVNETLHGGRANPFRKIRKLDVSNSRNIWDRYEDDAFGSTSILVTTAAIFTSLHALRCLGGFWSFRVKLKLGHSVVYSLFRETVMVTQLSGEQTLSSR